MNWPFIIFWLLVFAGIILVCAFIGRIFGSTMAGVTIGVVCSICVLIYGLVKTPWFH